jgi:(4S)-4-hydroxy-5-phosphonooxypentane-2,3-dione isomerase
MTAPAAGGLAITVALELVEGALPDFLLLVSENAALSVAQEAGCLRFDVLTPLDDATASVLLYEIYSDGEAFERHLASEHFLAFDRRSRELVRSKTVTRFSVAVNAKQHDCA